KSEMDRLSKKKKNLENSISRLKEALFNAMQVTGTDKIKGDLFTLRIQNNAPQLPKDLDVNQVPIEFLVEREYDIDKRKLLAAVKNGEVDGIKLEVKQSLRIS
ncbi:MAG: siphovirus Gp157 family protein, partial [Erysipelotrichaceae bacterium]|nr:siphovirus Gp157 family protein [Erysipelotrichaceae bacterium]